MSGLFRYNVRMCRYAVRILPKWVSGCCRNTQVALAQKYEPMLLALESMRPELVAELSARIEAAAGLFPRTDASKEKSQGGASYLRKKKPG